MKRVFILAFAVLIFSANAFAHQPFELVSSDKKTIKLDDLIKIEKERTIGKKDGTTLTFTEKEIRMVIVTGPEDDMLSYRIFGMRNPTIVVPSGAVLRILFVNKDSDMKHDIRFGHVEGEFTIAPVLDMTAGSTKLDHMLDDESMLAEEIVIKAAEDGIYKYFCSVRGHAKGGMWGNIVVGVKAGDLKTPEKTKHVHSPDEDKMDNMPGMKHDEKKPDDDMSNMPGMDHQHGGMQMSSTANIGDPMSRESSGTAWNPDSSPMHAYSKMYNDGGMLMLMGTGFLRYTAVGSSRDVSAAGKGSRSRVDAPSMAMLMYSRPAGKNAQLGFRVMASLDPLIQRGYGYPLLYQSGELFHGQPIHDRQHPHDLISELAMTYSYKFDEKRSFYLYAGYPGEPALGPPTFMHRVSASNIPDAPIGHHWQDASHITFGVVTAGFSFGKVKVEASGFNGREPDENRWAFDRPRLDSFSGRISWNPTKNWALQISHGYLTRPERSEPDLKVLRRTTASAIYNKMFDENRNWASTFVWGQNYAAGERTNSYLFESNYDFYKNAVFGRIENVQKTGHDLVLSHADEHRVFNVGAYSIGYLRDVYRDKGVDVGFGVMATLNTNPTALVPYYGGTTHGGWQVFMRIRPSKMNH